MGDVQFIRGTPRKSTLARAVEAAQMGMQGYQSGQDRRMAQGRQGLSDALTLAKIQGLQDESQGLNAPVPVPDYFRDPASGKLYPKDPYRGRGTTVNLPFQFDAGQKDEDSDIFNSSDEADSAGLPAGTVVMVINPATGEPEEYEV
jgi:hypothetical protein